VAAAVAPVGVSGILADQVDSPLLDLAAVKYLVAARPIPALAERQVHPGPGTEVADLWIYENADCLPRVRFASRARVMSRGVTKTAIREGTFDLRAEVLLDEASSGIQDSGPVLGPSRLSVLKDDPGELVVAVDAHHSGWLVVADSWYPGWRAEVSFRGKTAEAPVLRAFTCFRAVPLDKGSQTVRLVYRPISVALGAAVSALAVIGLLLGALARGPRAAGPIPSRDPGSRGGS
jgi:hypothetical protein